MRIKIKSFANMEAERKAAGIDVDEWYLHITLTSMRRYFAGKYMTVTDPNYRIWSADCYKVSTPKGLWGNYLIAKWLVEEIEED